MEETTLAFTNEYGEILLEGVEEILGDQDTRRVMQQATQIHQNQSPHKSSETAKTSHSVEAKYFHKALEEVFGISGGKGVAHRAGQAAFKTILKRHGDEMGLASREYRMLPSSRRMKTGLEALAKAYSVMSSTPVTVVEHPDHWSWHIQDCPVCGRQIQSTVTCQFTLGLLQGFLAWASAGKFYEVQETECAQEGCPACVIRISKQALE